MLQCYCHISKCNATMESSTILIYKEKGDQSDVCNWRPISICSILRRIIERLNDRKLNIIIISISLNNYIVSNENQVGFMQVPGTFINTSIINACLEKSKKEKIDCCIILLDVEKAFEETSHRHLKLKLKHEKIPTKLRNEPYGKQYNKNSNNEWFIRGNFS